MAYNMLRPNKKFSQLIAQSWIEGKRLKIDKEWLLENNLISKAEAPFYDSIVVNENPEPNPSEKDPNGIQYIGRIEVTEKGKLNMYVPYPQYPNDPHRPSGEPAPTPDELKDWVDNTTDWVPKNIWIPYTC